MLETRRDVKEKKTNRPLICRHLFSLSLAFQKLDASLMRFLVIFFLILIYSNALDDLSKCEKLNVDDLIQKLMTSVSSDGKVKDYLTDIGIIEQICVSAMYVSYYL